MDTVVAREADADLQLLTHWGDPIERNRSRQAAVLSVAAHAALIAVLIWLPAEVVETPPDRPIVEHVTPLVDPPTVLTQKEPSKGPIAKQLSAAELAPRPKMQAPPGIAAASRASAPKPAPLPPAPAPKKVAVATPPPTPLPEAPKVDTPKEPPHSTLPPVATPPPLPAPPQIQAEEHKPSSPFETPDTPPPANPTARSPFGNPVDEALNHVVRTPDGRFNVGDPNYSIGGTTEGTIPPGIGSPGSPVQLLTDPQGVDFRAYLFRVLNEVRRHWQAIIPESVSRLGLRGSVAIQFAIDRHGMVPKLVFVPGRKSGSDALDRAAVAGISASVPFPPLPTEFKGSQIVLQFEFDYNTPKK